MSKTIYSAGPVQNAIVDDVKAPLVELMNSMYGDASTGGHYRNLWRVYRAMSKLPEPTKENTWHSNTHLLIDIRDEFFKWESNLSRIRPFKVIWNFVIILYDYDAYYRDRIDWVVEKLFAVAHLWKPREPNKPRLTFWREFDESRARRMAEKELMRKRGGSL